MARFILRALIAAAGLWLASKLVHGIVFLSTGSLLWAAVLLGLVNAVVRPIVILLTLPFTLVTFGLFLIVINAAMLEFVALVLRGFAIHGFWAAVLGSLVISLVSWAGSLLIHEVEPGPRA